MRLLLGNHGQFRAGVPAAAPAGPTPLVWYEFNDSTDADGTSANGGTLANSGSGGSALNANIKGCTWTTGYTGRALKMVPIVVQANRDRISTSTNSALNLTTGATLMFRGKFARDYFNRHAFFGLYDSPNVDNGGGNNVFEITVRGSNSITSSTQTNAKQVRCYVRTTSDNGSVKTDAANVTGSVDAWRHYCISYNGTNFIFYVDGASLFNTTGATGNFTSAGDLFISLGWVSFTNEASYFGWDGDIDDFRLYNSVLTATEIAAIAAQ